MSFLWTVDKSNRHSLHLKWGGNLCEMLFRYSKPWPHIRMRRNEHVNDTKHTCTRLMVSLDRVVFAVHIDLLVVWLLFGIVVAAINRLIVVCGALCSLITTNARVGRERERKKWPNKSKATPHLKIIASISQALANAVWSASAVGQAKCTHPTSR